MLTTRARGVGGRTTIKRAVGATDDLNPQTNQSDTVSTTKSDRPSLMLKNVEWNLLTPLQDAITLSSGMVCTSLAGRGPQATTTEKQQKDAPTLQTGQRRPTTDVKPGSTITETDLKQPRPSGAGAEGSAAALRSHPEVMLAQRPRHEELRLVRYFPPRRLRGFSTEVFDEENSEDVRGE